MSEDNPFFSENLTETQINKIIDEVNTEVERVQKYWEDLKKTDPKLYDRIMYKMYLESDFSL